jgi:hypothetical protein
MKSLRGISKALFLIPLAALIYDLVNEWFVHAVIKVRSLQEWLIWMDEKSLETLRPLLNAVLSPNLVTKLLALPAPLAFAIPPAILYAIYWVWFQVKGGHGAGKIIFRSHD